MFGKAADINAANDDAGAPILGHNTYYLYGWMT